MESFAQRFSNSLERLRAENPAAFSLLERMCELRLADPHLRLAPKTLSIDMSLDIQKTRRLLEIIMSHDAPVALLHVENPKKRNTRYILPVWTYLFLLRGRVPELRDIYNALLSKHLEWRAGGDVGVSDENDLTADYFDLGVFLQPAFVADIQLNLTAASDSFMRLFNLSQEQLPIRLKEVFKRVYSYQPLANLEDPRVSLWDHILVCLGTGKPVSNAFFRFTPDDRNPMVVQAYVNFQRDRVGFQGTLVVASRQVENFQKLVLGGSATIHRFFFLHELPSINFPLHSVLEDILEDLDSLGFDSVDSLRAKVELAKRKSEEIAEALDHMDDVLSYEASDARVELMSYLENAKDSIEKEFAGCEIELKLEDPVPPSKVLVLEGDTQAIFLGLQTLMRNGCEAAIECGRPPELRVKIRRVAGSDNSASSSQFEIRIIDNGDGLTKDKAAELNSGQDIESTKESPHRGLGVALLQESLPGALKYLEGGNGIVLLTVDGHYEELGDQLL